MATTLAHITPRSSGYQVRLPKRAGGGSKFFSIPSGPQSMGGQAAALRSACRWRDKKFDDAGVLVTSRVFNDPNAGVNRVPDHRTGTEFAAAVWQYENKQMKRMFSIDNLGEELAFTLAHIARDFGVRAEADRQLEMTNGHALPDA